MVHIVLGGQLKQYTGGRSQVEVEAGTIHQLFVNLEKQFPELAPHIEGGLAVVIDGQIYQDSWFEPISDENEVHILPQIAGG
ncbi:MAG: MoaD/ThiS family protein [Methyloligellaceae bacterium]